MIYIYIYNNAIWSIGLSIITRSPDRNPSRSNQINKPAGSDIQLAHPSAHQPSPSQTIYIPSNPNSHTSTTGRRPPPRSLSTFSLLSFFLRSRSAHCPWPRPSPTGGGASSNPHGPTGGGASSNPHLRRRLLHFHRRPRSLLHPHRRLLVAVQPGPPRRTRRGGLAWPAAPRSVTARPAQPHCSGGLLAAESAGGAQRPTTSPAWWPSTSDSDRDRHSLPAWPGRRRRRAAEAPLLG